MSVRSLLSWIVIPAVLLSMLFYLLFFPLSPVPIALADAGYEPESKSNIFPPDLNRADRDALMLLPGIGEKTADAILEYRSDYGPFQSPEELILVSGIGEKKLSGILPLYQTTNNH